MPIFELTKEIVFPDPELADRSGIIAVGGDLSAGRLLQAYRSGIFPWYNEGDPIVWWSPHPRMILNPGEVKISHSMKKILKDGFFSVTFDKDFEAVLHACKAQPRPGQKGTWITKEIIKAYASLHEMGYAHSVEVWRNETLSGGLYGISIGAMFAGESMFSRVSNASKTGFITLAKTLGMLQFTFIDCQVYTPHLASLGAREMSRKKFLRALAGSLEKPTLKGNWGKMKQFQTVSAGCLLSTIA